METRKLAKGGQATYRSEVAFYERIMDALENGRSARTVEIAEEEREFTHDLNLLSAKPVLYVANINEDEVADPSENPHIQVVREIAAAEKSESLAVSAEIEAEIAMLEDDERSEFLQDLGLSESGLDKIIKSSYSLLGLISYLTAGPDECRAWTIIRGTKAPQAAGKIHSDFERGFIRAEVISFDDLKACGSMAAAKEKGLVRSEGKEYVVADGDIILFRFNV